MIIVKTTKQGALSKLIVLGKVDFILIISNIIKVFVKILPKKKIVKREEHQSGSR